MIKFFKRLFRKELPSILKVFDKAHADLTKYIDRTFVEREAAQAALRYHSDNLDAARTIRTNLTRLTSGE